MEDDLEEAVCPYCSKTFFSDKRSKLLVSTQCGHSLCVSCKNRMFQASAQIKCPLCESMLKVTDYREPLFDDGKTEQDVHARKRILRIYNKEEEDFESLDAYNDYLEHVEDIIYGIVNNIDRAAYEKEVQQYESRNAALIMRISRRKARREHEKVKAQKQKEEEARRAEDERKYQENASNSVAAVSATLAASVGSIREYMPTSVGNVRALPKPVDASLVTKAALGQQERIFRETATQLSDKEAAAATAGGYTRTLSDRRFIREAVDGLFVFPLNA